MENPIIGITLDDGPTVTGYSNFAWYAIRKNYSDSIYKAGGIPFFISSELKLIKNYLDIIHGLLVTGGDFDIDPKLYGEKKNSSKISLKKERTNFEFQITKYAVDKNLPLLGICGGQQLLNVVLGGTLIQHIPDFINTNIKHEQANPRNEASHIVKINKGTKLKKIIGTSEMFVNSAHHQAVKELGERLIINAKSNDGIIEGFESTDLDFYLGIQWHPEFLIDPGDLKIFESFISYAKKYRKKSS